MRVLRGTCGRQIRNQRHLVSIPQRIDTPVLLPTCSLPPHPNDLTAASNRLGAGRILCLLGTHEHANERRPPSNQTFSEGGLYPLFLDCHGRVWHVFKFGGGGSRDLHLCIWIGCFVLTRARGSVLACEWRRSGVTQNMRALTREVQAKHAGRVGLTTTSPLHDTLVVRKYQPQKLINKS